MAHFKERLVAVALPRLAKKPGIHSDGGGLNLKVRPDRSPMWTYRFMINRVAREMGLGTYPEVSLSHARQLAADARALRSEGKNPIIARATARAMSSGNNLRLRDRARLAGVPSPTAPQVENDTPSRRVTS